MQVPDRGDLVYVNFHPQAGHEQDGRRPAIVLSPKAFNEVTKFAVVCPITSREKGYPFEVKLPEDLPIQKVVLTDRGKSLDWRARRFRIIWALPWKVKCLDFIHT